MSGRIKITGVPNEHPNVRLYVLALLGLARQIVEEEERTGRRRKDKRRG